MAISGTYQIGADSPMGRLDGVLTLRSTGGGLSGTLTVMGNTIALENGTSDGDTFAFVVDAQTPMGPMKITANGIVNGDRISGDIATALGQMPFEGTRTAEI